MYNTDMIQKTDISNKNPNSSSLKLPHIPFLWWAAGLILGLAGLVLGSMYDYRLDSVLYNPISRWSVLMAGYAPLPCFWWIAGAGMCLGRSKSSSSKIRTWGARFFCAAAVIGSIAYMTYSGMKETGLLWIPALLISCIAVGLPAWIISREILQVPLSERRHIIGVILFVCIGQFLIVQILKDLVMRPRFIALVTDSALSFHPWWQNGQQAARDFAGLYAENADLFRSFPSAHTAAAACSFLGCLLAWCSPRFHTGPFFAGALLFTLLTALSRIIVGYHFLSDVSVGFLITYVLFWIAWTFFTSPRHL